MSRSIAAAAIRGAHKVVGQAEADLKAALEKHGHDKPVAFPSTGYYLPTIYGLTGHKIEKLGDMVPTLAHAKELLSPEPAESLWLPYLGNALDAGMATLFAEELIEGIRSLDGNWPTTTLSGERYNGPIDDPQMRTWGIQLVDGRMPGFAAIVGTAKSNEVAVKIVRELQARGILILTASGSPERGNKTFTDQLIEKGVEIGYNTYIVPFGSATISAVHALGLATRSSLSFGGLKPGQAEDILLYNK